MRKFRIALLLFAAFDFFIGGTMGGFLALTPVVAAQNKPQYPYVSGAPDCILVPPGPFTAVGDSAVYDNRNQGCTTWHLVYNSQGFSAENISFKSADDSGNGPGAFTNWGTSGGTLAAGTTLPLTSTTSGQATGYKYRPFIKISITSVTGSGSIWPMLYGYRPGLTDSNGTGSAGAATTTAGTASAATQPGYPMICDSLGSGAVTAGQAQMVKCGTTGVLALVLNAGNGDSVTAAEGGLEQIGSSALPLQVAPKFWNGATTSRPYVASLANFPTSQTTTARNLAGAQLFAPPPDWVVNSQPAVSNVASASIAAEALTRHVLDKVCFSAGATTAPVATQLVVNIRDGAAGAGVILQSFQVIIPATVGQHVAPFCTPSLNLVGTTNTAMTAEFSSLLTNEFEQVSISGFNIN